MKFFLYTFILLLVPFNFGFAQVVISEIMYDLEGSDSGREWVEIENIGPDSIDLTDWKFFENDTNHTLILVTGSASFSTGSYAVIADNTGKFLLDYPGFSGTLFDSAFSLKNTGELISIRDQDGNDIDSVFYNPLWGAEEDGNSLQLSGGSFTPALPTPGTGSGVTSPTQLAENTEVNETEENTESDEVSSGSGSSGSSSSSIYVEPFRETIIYADVGSDRTVTVGADEFFEASALKTDKTDHPYAVFRWNFGNGVTGEGRSVLHSYDYPGTYVVQLTTYSPGGTLSDTDRMTVKAVPTLVTVSYASPYFIEIYNQGSREIDLSMWSISSGGLVFSFPDGTIILAGAKLKFLNTVTGLRANGINDTALLFPNGGIAYNYIQSTARFVYPKTVVTTVTSSGVEEISDSSRPVAETSETLAAAPVLAEAETGVNGLYKWILALIGLIGVTIGGLLFVRPKEMAPETVTSDDIKLVD